MPKRSTSATIVAKPVLGEVAYKHKLVRMFTDDDGDEVDSSVWHFVYTPDGADRTLCEGHAVGIGESTAKVEFKEVKRGGITCRRCLATLKEFKRVKL